MVPSSLSVRSDAYFGGVLTSVGANRKPQARHACSASWPRRIRRLCGWMHDQEVNLNLACINSRKADIEQRQRESMTFNPSIVSETLLDRPHDELETFLDAYRTFWGSDLLEDITKKQDIYGATRKCE